MKVKSESENEVAQSYPTFATPQTAAYQAPLSMGFSRQEYWSGVPLPSPLIQDVMHRVRDTYMVFPVVMYGCESQTIKKAEH